LICFNGPDDIDRATQCEMLDRALELIQAQGDLVNKVVEITVTDEGIVAEVYSLPFEM
jgi:hypothetical protein